MENGWMKHFQDGSTEIGADRLTDQGHASWSLGRLSNIVTVCLHCDDLHATIESNHIGEFWQSDEMEAALFRSSARCVKRRIQRKIQDKDAMFVVRVHPVPNSKTGQMVDVEILTMQDISWKPKHVGDMFPITDSNKGKWFTLEIDIKDQSISYYFADDKI
jgi:hypothetical protein